MNLNWTDSVLTSSRKNISLNKRLDKLLIENQSIQINYSKYFDECAPLICTYTTTSQTNFFKCDYSISESLWWSYYYTSFNRAFVD